MEIHVLFPKQKSTDFNPFSNFLIPGSDTVPTMELTKQHIVQGSEVSIYFPVCQKKH